MGLFARLCRFVFGKRPAGRREASSFQPALRTCEERNAPGSILTAPVVDAVVLPVVGALVFGDELGLPQPATPPAAAPVAPSEVKPRGCVPPGKGCQFGSGKE